MCRRGRGGTLIPHLPGMTTAAFSDPTPRPVLHQGPRALGKLQRKGGGRMRTGVSAACAPRFGCVSTFNMARRRYLLNHVSNHPFAAKRDWDGTWAQGVDAHLRLGIGDRARRSDQPTPVSASDGIVRPLDDVRHALPHLNADGRSEEPSVPRRPRARAGRRAPCRLSRPKPTVRHARRGWSTAGSGHRGGRRRSARFRFTCAHRQPTCRVLRRRGTSRSCSSTRTPARSTDPGGDSYAVGEFVAVHRLSACSSAAAAAAPGACNQAAPVANVDYAAVALHISWDDDGRHAS